MSTTALACAFLLGSVTLAACADDGLTPDDDDDGDHAAVAGGDDPHATGGAIDVPAPLATGGAYRLESTLAVEAGALVPGTAGDALATLAALRDHPAHTLFELAEDAGLPAVGTLRDALPSALESRIEAWIDEAIRDLPAGDGALPLVIDGVLQLAHTEVGEVRLQSRLAIAGGAAVHRLDGIELDVAGAALAFDVAPLATIGAELEVPVRATIAHDAQDALVTLEAHAFGVPYGRIAWRALDALVRARYGADVRGLFGAAVACDVIAADVADRCLLGVCVGHEADLRAICEAGLDHAVAELRARVEAMAVTPILLDGGAARMTDGAPADRRASTIDGTWSARLDVGNGPRVAPATFTGARE